MEMDWSEISKQSHVTSNWCCGVRYGWEMLWSAECWEWKQMSLTCRPHSRERNESRRQTWSCSSAALTGFWSMQRSQTAAQRQEEEEGWRVTDEEGCHYRSPGSRCSRNSPSLEESLLTGRCPRTAASLGSLQMIPLAPGHCYLKKNNISDWDLI